MAERGGQDGLHLCSSLHGKLDHRRTSLGHSLAKLPARKKHSNTRGERGENVEKNFHLSRWWHTANLHGKVNQHPGHGMFARRHHHHHQAEATRRDLTKYHTSSVLTMSSRDHAHGSPRFSLFTTAPPPPPKAKQPAQPLAAWGGSQPWGLNRQSSQ